MIINKRQITKFGLKRKVNAILLLNISDEEKQLKINNLIRIKLDEFNEYQKNLYHTNKEVKKVWNNRCNNHYHTNRNWVYKKRGNCCEICGSTKNLDLAHRVPSEKKENMGQLLTRPDYMLNEECKEEEDKTDLLCRSCHFHYDKSWGKLYPHLQTEQGYLIFQKALRMWREGGSEGRFINFLREKKYFAYI